MKFIGVALFWVTLWFIISKIINFELLVPTPFQTVKALIGMFNTTVFWKAVFISIIRIVLGFCVAMVVGTSLGLLAFRLPFIKTVLDPFINIIRATPVASFIVLAFVWIKTNFIPSFISVLIVLPIFYTNIQDGCNRIDCEIVELCKIMQTTKREKLRAYILPALLPSFKNAAVNGIGLAWKSGIAAEVICRPYTALGTILSNGKNALETSQVFAVTLVIILLSLLFDSIIKIIVYQIQYL